MLDLDPSHPAGLWGLFLSALISATLFPGGSELLLAALAAQQGGHDPATLLAVATLGNTLGGMSTWLLGRLIGRRYPARELAKPRQRQALGCLQRWGSPFLLLSWLPVLGDGLCLAAGWLRIGWLPALAFIATGKALRYAVVIMLAG